MERKKAKAIQDCKIMREDGGYTNFIKGHAYPCIVRKNEKIQFVLMDEDKRGFACDKQVFQEHFELLEETK